MASKKDQKEREEKLIDSFYYKLTEDQISSMAKKLKEMLELSKKPVKEKKKHPPKKDVKENEEEKIEKDIKATVADFVTALNKWRGRFEGKDVIISLGKKFNTYVIELVIPNTEAADPFEDVTKDEDLNYSEIERSLADDYTYVVYDYKNGANTLRFSFRKPANSVLPMIIAFAAAVALGVIFRLFFHDTGVWLAEQIINPAASKFISVLKMIATPMMFFLLLTTICKLGTRKQLGGLGKNLINGIWLTLILTAVASVVISFAFFGIRITGAETQTENQFAAIRDMIMDIMPASALDPFISGNALQIVFLAIVFGLAIFIRKTQNTALITVCGQIDQTLQLLMKVINNVMPVYVFFSIFSLTVMIDVSLIMSVWKLFVLFVSVIAFYYAWLMLKILIAVKWSFREFFRVLKAIRTPYTTAITTASSAAAFRESEDCSTDDFGIPKKEVDFYMGTGRTVYKPASACNYIVIACFFAYLSGTVNMSVSWYITLLITCIILGVATPPITGGAKTCYTILFLQLGIPAEWLAAVISIDTIFDFVRTGSNVGGLQAELLCIHEKEKKREAKKLKKQ